MEQRASLRVRKTARTRAAIVSSAQKLFDEQGYEATTLEQIAEMADVHKQTVLRYFRNKEEIALAFRIQAIEEFELGLVAPTRKVDPLTYWRHFALASAKAVARRGDLFKYNEFLRSDPRLFAQSLALEQRYEDALAKAFAADAGVDPNTDLFSMMIASFLVGGCRNVARQLARGGSVRGLERAVTRVIDYVEANVRRPTA
jgi:AcrR family transcriptional regulator